MIDEPDASIDWKSDPHWAAVLTPLELAMIGDEGTAEVVAASKTLAGTMAWLALRHGG